MDAQSAEQQDGRAVAGNTQRDHRDDCTADGSVVCNLGGKQTLFAAGAKLFRMLRAAFCGAVGDHIGQCRTHTGQEVDEQTNQERTENVELVFQDLLARKIELFDLLIEVVLAATVLCCIVDHDHAAGEQTDQDSQGIETTCQIERVKGKARGGGDGRVTDLGDKQAESCTDKKTRTTFGCSSTRTVLHGS